MRLFIFAGGAGEFGLAMPQHGCQLSSQFGRSGVRTTGLLCLLLHPLPGSIDLVEDSGIEEGVEPRARWALEAGDPSAPGVSDGLDQDLIDHGSSQGFIGHAVDDQQVDVRRYEMFIPGE